MIKRVYGFVKAYGSMGALPSIIAAVESGELEMAEFIAVNLWEDFRLNINQQKEILQASIITGDFEIV